MSATGTEKRFATRWTSARSSSSCAAPLSINSISRSRPTRRASEPVSSACFRFGVRTGGGNGGDAGVSALRTARRIDSAGAVRARSAVMPSRSRSATAVSRSVRNALIATTFAFSCGASLRISSISWKPST